MSPVPLNTLDLVVLSDTAWEVVDPDGEQEADEQAWTALLPDRQPPVETIDALRDRLEAVVTAASPPARSGQLRAVAAVMTFMAAHADRRDRGEALLRDALHEEYGGDLPADVVAWLGSRRATRGRFRRHGGGSPQRARTRPRHGGLD